MHKFEALNRIRNVRGKIIRTVTAEWKDKLLDVYREDEDGNEECRNLYYQQIAGYCVAFPGERMKYSGSLEIIESWGKCRHTKVGFLGFQVATDEDKKAVLAKYPDFRYTIEKYERRNHSISCGLLMGFLRVWKSHKEMETLVEAGFERLALTAEFWKINGDRKRRAMQFLRDNGGDWTMADLNVALRYKLTGDELKSYNVWKSQCRMKCGYPAYRYLLTQGKSWNVYDDHIKMLKTYFPERLKDEYWTKPKSLRARHAKLISEVENLIALRKAESDAAAKMALEEKARRYSESVINASGKKTRFGTLSVFVPSSVEEIEAQAKALHQCLITNDYIQDVIDHNCILVFIRKGSAPVATAEIRPNGTVGQFYGDEAKYSAYGKDSCLPTRSAKNALEKFLKEFDAKTLFAKKSRKAMRRAAA